MSIKVVFYTLIVSIVFFNAAHAQNKVVVIPLGGSEDTTLSTQASFSIPVGSVRSTLTGGFPGEYQPDGVLIVSSGSTGFGTTFVVPDDHVPGTLLFLDLYVYNRTANGACQASIIRNYGRRSRVGEPVSSGGAEFSTASSFPTFTSGNTTNIQTYQFGPNASAGDVISFGLLRQGDNVADNCGFVNLSGLNVRYQRK